MQTLYAAGLALALTLSTGHHAFAQTDRITGGYTTIAFSSDFISFTLDSDILISDLDGNAPPNGAQTLSAAQGAVDLQTGATDVAFKGGFQVVYLNKTTVRVENLVLTATKTASTITGDVIQNGHLLGRQEVFVVNKNPNLSLPLQPNKGVLTLPTLSLGLSPNFLTQLTGVIGPLINAGTVVATATPVAVVVPDNAAAQQGIPE